MTRRYGCPEARLDTTYYEGEVVFTIVVRVAGQGTEDDVYDARQKLTREVLDGLADSVADLVGKAGYELADPPGCEMEEELTYTVEEDLS